MKTTEQSREYKCIYNSAVTCELRLWWIIEYRKVVINNTGFLETSNIAYIILMARTIQKLRDSVYLFLIHKTLQT